MRGWEGTKTDQSHWTCMMTECHWTTMEIINYETNQKLVFVPSFLVVSLKLTIKINTKHNENQDHSEKFCAKCFCVTFRIYMRLIVTNMIRKELYIKLQKELGNKEGCKCSIKFTFTITCMFQLSKLQKMSTHRIIYCLFSECWKSPTESHSRVSIQ